MDAYQKIEVSMTRDIPWPSDNLGVLREFVRCLPQFDVLFGELPQVRLVIDANVALGELIFRVKNRRQANARSSLHEVIASRTVIAYAPRTLRDEVEAKIPQVASRRGLPEALLREEWQAFKVLLHYYEPQAQVDRRGAEGADPNDLPYRDLWAAVGALGVYSKDRHLPRMGVPVITIDVVIALRDYSRAASIEVGIKVGSVLVAAAGIGLLRGILVLFSKVGRSLSRLPAPAQLAIAAVLVIAVAHPTSRRKLKTWVHSALMLLGETALPVLASASRSLSAAESEKALAWGTVSRQLSVGKRHSAKEVLRAVCIAANRPLSLIELQHRVLSAGYVSRAKNLRAYLRRILRDDANFAQIRPGYWIISRS